MSSGVHDRGRNQVTGPPPEVPRRPSITTVPRLPIPMPTESPVPTPVPPTGLPRYPVMPAVREIHKNAWLKRQHTSYDKKGAPYTKRSEKWWVVFCVHDDLEAYLEFYTEPKVATAHKPSSRIGLKTCLHVSPSIIGQDNEFEFVVTLPSQVIRLAAADWDQMLEWVESLQGKLREMNVLSPKDNLYSKLPEIRSCASSHYGLAFGLTRIRDPNSPLPPPPPPNDRISPVHIFGEYVDTSSSNPSGAPARAETHHTSITVSSDGRPFESFTTASVYVQSATNGSAFLRDGNASDSGNGSGGSHWSIDSTSPQISGGGLIPSQNNNTTSSNTSNPESRPSPVEVIIGNNNSTLVQIGFENPVEDPSQLQSSIAISASRNLSNGSAANDKSPRRSRPRANSRKFKTDLGLNLQTALLPVDGPSSSSSYTRQLSAPTAQVTQPTSAESTGGSNDNVYEHIFVAAGITSSEPTSTSVTFENRSNLSDEAPFPPVIPRRNSNGKRLHRRFQLQGCRSDVQGPQNSNGSDSSNSQTYSAGTRRNVTTVEDGVRHTPNQGDGRSEASLPYESAAQEIRPLEGMIGIRCGTDEYRIGSNNRRVGSQGESSTSETPSTTEGPPLAGSGGALAHVPLKESQVLRLKSEINHAPGVRIVLRRKDCINTIAFVDYLGAVWISGWKQYEFPVLYYAFHIGDQIVKIGGERVQSSEETRRAIKMTSSSQVEFIVRRLPYGRVFVLKRRVEGEPIGLVAVGNGNCAEISEVLPNSLAAREGLPPKAPSVDGQSLCNWFLTEINNRPLSLTARESEVRDRLNAVGKEISILVQPSDLVKHLKKQLKTMRGFKDYLLV